MNENPYNEFFHLTPKSILQHIGTIIAIRVNNNIIS
jgi:hypothetical protein